jgi:hypothetical protein
MQTWSRDEVLAATKEYFRGDDLAADVWTRKYALQTPDNRFLELTPRDMHRRLAREFARVEAKYPNPMSEDEIFALLDGYRDVVAQGSPMSGIGNPFQVQSLSNCFVIPSPHDSYGGIMMTDQQQAQIMKRRGGVGFDISTIRPAGMVTANAARTTDGLGVFMERFSNTCREVAQGGRRGALMLSLSCFVGSTPILTEDGWMEIREIVQNQYAGCVWTHEGFKPIDAYQEFDERDVYEIETDDGKTITVTGDHEFVVKNIISGEEYLKAIVDVDPQIEELVMYDVSFDKG